MCNSGTTIGTSWHMFSLCSFHTRLIKKYNKRHDIKRNYFDSILEHIITISKPGTQCKNDANHGIQKVSIWFWRLLIKVKKYCISSQTANVLKLIMSTTSIFCNKTSCAKKSTKLLGWHRIPSSKLLNKINWFSWEKPVFGYRCFNIPGSCSNWIWLSSTIHPY